MSSRTRKNSGAKKPHRKNPVKAPVQSPAPKHRKLIDANPSDVIEKDSIEIFRHLPAAAAIVSFNKLAFIEVNDAWCRESGYSREEALGRTPHELDLYDMSAERDPDLKELSKGAAVHSWQFEMRRKSGERIPYLASLAPLRWAGKKCIIVLFQNLSAQYELTRTLEENVTKFRSLFEGSRDAIGVSKAGIHEFVNQAYLDLFGYTSFDELRGRPLLDLIAPESRPQVLEILRLRSTGQGAPGFYETRGVRRDGSEFDMDVKVSVYEVNGQRFTLGLMRDITERRRADIARQRAEKLFQAIVEDQTEMIVRWKPDGTRTFVNQAYCRTFGKSFDELVGTSFWPLVAHPYRERELERIRTLSPDFPISTGIHESLLPDGKTQWQEWCDRGFFDDHGSLIELQSVGRDITERKMAEMALSESESAYKRLFDSSVNAIMVIQVLFDEQGKPYDHTFINGNPAYEQLTGTLVKDEIGKTSKDMFIKAPPELVVRLYQVAITGEPFEYERFNEQLERYFETRAFSPKKGQFAIVARDITERKQAEQKIQRQLQQLTALREVDSAISSTFAMSTSLEVILKTVVSLLGVSASAILLFDKSALTLEYAAGKGFRSKAIEKTRIKLGEGITGRAALERRDVWIVNITNERSGFGREELLKGERFLAYSCMPLVIKGDLIGILEVFHPSELQADEEWVNYFRILAGQTAIAIENSQLFDGLQRSNLELSVAYDATIEGWSRAMDYRDKETEGHTERVVKMSMDLARAMKIPEHDLVHFRRGALLHDMGKLGVPDAILLNPGKFTDEEREKMRSHPQIAHDLLSGIRYLKPALDIPYCHHEHWDGSGYPRGLKGEEIPLAARIFAVVDVWDSVTSERPYRPALTRSQALEYIKNESGKHFDPQVVELFMNQMNEN